MGNKLFMQVQGLRNRSSFVLFFSVFGIYCPVANFEFILVEWIKYKVYDIKPLSHIAKVHIYRVTVYKHTKL